MRRALILLFVLALPACAWTVDTVPVQRQATSVAVLPGAAGIGVSVTSSDARREREISHKKNGYGMRGADIMAANDVVAEVREGVREILAGKGFSDGRDATVRIEVSRFYNTFDTGFFSATGRAQIIANLTVTLADGRSAYARTYTSDFELPGVQIMTGDNAASALSGALGNLLRQIADDPQLNQALLQARPAPLPATPSPRRGRVGA